MRPQRRSAERDNKINNRMKNRGIQVLAAAAAAAGLLLLLFFLVKTKRLQVNRFIVTQRDTVGVDISEYQADVDMDTLVYAEMYRGDDGKPAYSKLMDITSLFYINSIVGDAVPGQKDSLDNMLSMFIEA